MRQNLIVNKEVWNEKQTPFFTHLNSSRLQMWLTQSHLLSSLLLSMIRLNLACWAWLLLSLLLTFVGRCSWCFHELLLSNSSVFPILCLSWPNILHQISNLFLETACFFKIYQLYLKTNCCNQLCYCRSDGYVYIWRFSHMNSERRFPLVNMYK